MDTLPPHCGCVDPPAPGLLMTSRVNVLPPPCGAEGPHAALAVYQTHTLDLLNCHGIYIYMYISTLIHTHIDMYIYI